MRNNKKVSRKVILKRRRIAIIIYRLFALIGFPIMFIGTGGDYGKFIPFLYITGFVMCLVSISLKYIIEETRKELNWRVI